MVPRAFDAGCDVRVCEVCAEVRASLAGCAVEDSQVRTRRGQWRVVVWGCSGGGDGALCSQIDDDGDGVTTIQTAGVGLVHRPLAALTSQEGGSGAEQQEGQESVPGWFRLV